MEYMEMVKNKGSFNGFLKMCVYENILLAKGKHYLKSGPTDTPTTTPTSFRPLSGNHYLKCPTDSADRGRTADVSVPYRGIIISNYRSKLYSKTEKQKSFRPLSGNHYLK